MDEQDGDLNRALMLDGNGAGGMLQEVFSAEMTAAPTECANCGRTGEMGSLLAFVQAPGLVLRCPACESAMVRIVRTGEYTYLDARGAVYLRIAR
jgi:Zn finger protein HypA/HybF involved in hydrogenase expression